MHRIHIGSRLKKRLKSADLDSFLSYNFRHPHCNQNKKKSEDLLQGLCAPCVQQPYLFDAHSAGVAFDCLKRRMNWILLYREEVKLRICSINAFNSPDPRTYVVNCTRLRKFIDRLQGFKSTVAQLLLYHRHPRVIIRI